MESPWNKPMCTICSCPWYLGTVNYNLLETYKESPISQIGYLRSRYQPCRVDKGKTSVVPRSRFLGDTGVPLPEFQGDIYKFWGTHQIFTCLIE